MLGMEMFNPNTDPKRRLVAVLEVSQNKTVKSKALYHYFTYDQLESEFPDSPAIKEFFDQSMFMDWCMVICLYELAGSKEIRRRMLKTQKPKNEESLRDLMEQAANSVGVQLDLHDLDA